MARVHPTAVVDPAAKLADDVEVGAFSWIGPGVELGPGVVVANHASLGGATRVGARTRIFPFAALGGEPQDRAFSGERTRLEIGADNVIREGVTLHVGTSRGGGCTRIGDDNLIMNGAHIAHDCQIGSHVIVASFCGLAGHVVVEDWAVLGAYTGVHQFARVGESVMTAANSMLSLDAPPFALVAGDRARIAGLNTVGLRRRDLPEPAVRALKHAFHLLFTSKLRFEHALARARDELADSPEVGRLLRFLVDSKRGVCR
ncbi:MAG TPA: acyl-ACP--UDP-N-acetylglucosamine O-acyltransferase [Myxococcota bacterium]|nr:acyl-ACP--UDP-N-acetylglucosamine O-acyltransferase [Myxococcota bacterium]